MKQKIIWTNYLIIGISFLNIFTINNCSDREELKTTSYIYKNNTGKDFFIEVYNSDNELIDNVEINNNSEKLILKRDSEVIIAPFAYQNLSNKWGNLVKIKFADNKCLSYNRDISDDIFNYRKYSNYSDELVKQKEISFIYTIDEEEYNLATACE